MRAVIAGVLVAVAACTPPCPDERCSQRTPAYRQAQQASSPPEPPPVVEPVAAAAQDAGPPPNVTDDTPPVPAPPTAEDLKILDGARARLMDEQRWNRKDNRECPTGAKTWSLFCALHDASIEVLGTYDHRRAALEEVRKAIEALLPAQDFEHRLMDFNNRPETRLADVHRVLAQARERIAAEVVTP